MIHFDGHNPLSIFFGIFPESSRERKEERKLKQTHKKKKKPETKQQETEIVEMHSIFNI